MLTSCFVLLVVGMRVGQVVSIPQSTEICPVGRANWVLRAEAIKTLHATRGRITRIAPEGMTGVVEVKVYDGTNRLGWLEAGALTVVGPPRGGQRQAQPRAMIGPNRPGPSPDGQTQFPRRRQVQQRQLMRIDVTLGRLMQAALSAAAAESAGLNPHHFPSTHHPLVDLTDPIVPLAMPGMQDIQWLGRRLHEVH